MTTYFDWDTVEDNIVEEFDDAGTTVADYTTEPYLYGDLVSQRRGGQSQFYHYDGMGSATELTLGGGFVTDTRQYSAFGEGTELSGTSSFPFQYIGEKGYYHDIMLAQYVGRQREYRPLLGRWSSSDPAGLKTTNINVYTYVWNSPTIKYDPSGWNGRVGPHDPHACDCALSLSPLLNNPAFRDLQRCAIASGCLRERLPIICVPCEENAAYVHGTVEGSHITVCSANWILLSPAEQAEILYEELYHSITICGWLQWKWDFPPYEHRRNYSTALKALVNLYHTSLGGRFGNFGCFMCVGQEFLAKACARRSSGRPFPNPRAGDLWGTVSASCTSCMPTDFLPGSPEYGLLLNWFDRYALNECVRLDLNCILEGSRGPQ